MTAGSRPSSDHGRPDEDGGPIRERSEHQPQRDHGAQVVDEARAEDALAEFGLVETGFEHDGIDDGHRRGGQGDAGKPACLGAPSQREPGHGRAAQEGREKTEQPDHQHFLPLRLHGRRVEFRPRQEGQQDRADRGNEAEPVEIRAQGVGVEPRSAASAATIPTQISTRAIEIRKWLATMAERTARASQTAAIA